MQGVREKGVSPTTTMKSHRSEFVRSCKCYHVLNLSFASTFIMRFPAARTRVLSLSKTTTAADDDEF